MRNREVVRYVFYVPLIVLSFIVMSLLIKFAFDQEDFSNIFSLIAIIVGSFELVKETIKSLIHRKFALDYIALLAIIVSVLNQEYIVGAVITLMLAGGNALEKYAEIKARGSLTALAERIPHQVLIFYGLNKTKVRHIEDVRKGEHVLVRKGEVIPLDGILIVKGGLVDESSLTGEPYPIEKYRGDVLRSGTLNVGESIIIKVEKEDKDSTYKQIIKMVEAAQKEKAPMIRLADKYSVVFTITTLVIASLAYIFTRDINYVLAVLVIATPCPLILATPVALIGGVNSAAHKRIIIKRMSGLEVLAKTDILIFDKTGTLTLGVPEVSRVVVKDKNYELKEVLGISCALERNSLHPVAKAIVNAAKANSVQIYEASNIKEVLGDGISGDIGKKHYTLSGNIKDEQRVLELRAKGKLIALVYLKESIRPDTKKVIYSLHKGGYKMMVYTGDSEARASELVTELGVPIEIKAKCKPEDKKEAVANLKNSGKIVTMVGDGINDAPALAMADIGLVFSNEEHTAASDAADVVFLNGNFTAVKNSLDISKKTIHIAKESIFVGIGLSVIGMIFASFGFIPAIYGAFIQEGIDIAVILNALRASR